MSRTLYKSIAVLIFSLLLIWGIVSLWGYVSYYNGSEVGDKYSLLFSFILEAIAILLIIFAPKGTFRFNKLGSAIILWLVYVTTIVLATSEGVLMEMRAIFWWPSIYILSCFIFRSHYAHVGYKIFLNYFIPVAFLSNTLMFFYLRSIQSMDGLFFASNQVFYISMLLPLLFLLKRRWMKYIGLLTVVVCASISFKRSTLLITVAALLFSIIFEMKGRKAKFSSILLVSAIIGLSVYLFAYINSNSEGYLYERLFTTNETGGSGRIDIYQNVFNKYKDLNSFEKLFGNGYNSVVKKGWAIDNGVFVSAHNDFLEILVDYGIIGLLVFLHFIIQVISNVIKSRPHEKLFQANVIMLVVFIVMSSVSHLILYPSYFAYLVILISLTQVSIENRFCYLS